MEHSYSHICVLGWAATCADGISVLSILTWLWGVTSTDLRQVWAPMQYGQNWVHVQGGLIQIDASDQEVWGVSSSGDHIWKNPVDGSGRWIQVTSGLAITWLICSWWPWSNVQGRLNWATVSYIPILHYRGTSSQQPYAESYISCSPIQGLLSRTRMCWVGCSDNIVA